MKTQTAQNNSQFFTDHAFFFLEHAAQILSDSRMFFAPVSVRNGLDYVGPRGFANPTLGIYITWWLNNPSDTQIEIEGKRALVYQLAGSPLSGCNCCRCVSPNGVIHTVEHPNFHQLYRSFIAINHRYKEQKATAEYDTLEVVYLKLNGPEDDTPSILAREKNGMQLPERIKLDDGLTTSAIYELEIWEREGEIEVNEDYLDSCDGMMSNGQSYKRTIGYYPTKERAEQAMAEEIDYIIDLNHQECFSIIRQKPAYTQIEPSDYLKVWTYQHNVLLSETLQNNFSSRYNPFCGRPQSKTHFRKGQIVLFLLNNHAYWGIVNALPPIPEEVPMAEHLFYHQKIQVPTLTFSDDCYDIIYNIDESGQAMHYRALVHQVFCPDVSIPPFVEKRLKDAISIGQ